jgi:hypothetical protein
LHLGPGYRLLAQPRQHIPDETSAGRGAAKFGIADSFRQGGKYQEGFAVRHDGQGYFVYFEEYDGEWLISSM